MLPLLIHSTTSTVMELLGWAIWGSSSTHFECEAFDPMRTTPLTRTDAGYMASHAFRASTTNVRQRVKKILCIPVLLWVRSLAPILDRAHAASSGVCDMVCQSHLRACCHRELRHATRRILDTVHQGLVVYAFYHYLVTGYGLPATLFYLSW